MSDAARLAEIIGAIHRVMKPVGFSKVDKRLWTRKAEETTQRLRLEKSSYGSQNWLTIHCSLNRLQAGEFPVAADFTLKFILARAVPDPALFKQALDAGHLMSEGERRTVIAETLRTYCLPILERLSTEVGCIALYKEINNANTFLIHAVTLRQLGLES